MTAAHTLAHRARATRAPSRGGCPKTSPSVRIWEIGLATLPTESPSAVAKASRIEVLVVVNVEISGRGVVTGGSHGAVPVAGISLPGDPILADALEHAREVYLATLGWDTAFGHHARAAELGSLWPGPVPGLSALGRSLIDQAVFAALLVGFGCRAVVGRANNLAGVDDRAFIPPNLWESIRQGDRSPSGSQQSRVFTGAESGAPERKLDIERPSEGRHIAQSLLRFAVTQTDLSLVWQADTYEAILDNGSMLDQSNLNSMNNDQLKWLLPHEHQNHR
jgi:hypothetical protein